MRTPLPTLSSLATAALAMSATAQDPAPTGNFANTAFGLVWNEGGPTIPRQVRARGLVTPGRVDALPGGGSAFPGYDLASITPAVALLLGRASVDSVVIDGLSSGNDLTPMTFIAGATPAEDRFAILPPIAGNTQWGAIFFGVDESAVFPPLPETILSMQ
jgi:hypothetical protein